MKAILFSLLFTCNLLFSQTLEDFKSMLGENILTNMDIFNYRHELGGFEAERSLPTVYHLQFFDAGIEMNVSKEDNTLQAIFLKGPSTDWYKTYAKELPLELKWEMTKNEVEALIGKGKEKIRFGDKTYYQYPQHNIEIKYTDDEKQQLASIQIRMFE